MEAMGLDLKFDRGFTISTKNKIRRKDLIKKLHKTIKKIHGGNIDEHIKLSAIVVGDCLKGESQYSRHYHLVFSRDLTKEEKEEITKSINEDDRFIGGEKVKTKWGIYNDNGYIFTSEDHRYWNKVKIV